MPLVIGRQRAIRLAAICIYALMSLFPAYASADITHNLVGWWKFDEGTSTVTHDSSGYSSNGTLVGATKPQWVNGKFGNALSFNGTNYVNISSVASKIASSSVSVSLWVKSPTVINSSLPAIETLYSLGGFGSNNDMTLQFFTTGVARFIYWDPNFTQHNTDTSQSSWAANTWYHVAFTFSTSSATAIYVNGVLSNSGSFNVGRGNNVTSSSSIGVMGDASGAYFSGTIDDVRIYNRVLSATDVAQLYNETQSYIRKPANNLGMVAWWKFDEGTSTNTWDASGNSYNGILGTSTPPTWVPGKLGKALSFNGIGAYVHVPSLANVNLSGQMSVCAWAIAASSTNLTEFSNGSADHNGVDNYIISKVNNNSIGGGGTQFEASFHTDFNGTGFQFGWEDNTGGYVYWESSPTSSVPIQWGTWYHVCATKTSNTSANFYINGSVVTSYELACSSFTNGSCGNTKPVTLSGFTVDIGGLISTIINVSAWWNGRLDDLRLYNRVLSPYEVSNIYQSSGPVKVASAADLHTGSSLTQGLVGYYTFDGKDTPWSSATAGTAIDRSGQGHNGTLTSMTRAGSPTIGKIGQALVFDGSSNYVNTSSVAGSLASGSSFTISGWFRLAKRIVGANFSNDQSLFVLSDASSQNDIYFNFDHTTGSLEGQYLNNLSSQVGVTSPETSWNANTWYHAVFTYNSSNQVSSLYVNGALDTSFTDTGHTRNSGTASNAAAVGANSAGPNKYFNGALDDVRVYNRALTDQEVKQLYKLGQATLRP